MVLVIAYTGKCLPINVIIEQFCYIEDVWMFKPVMPYNNVLQWLQEIKDVQM